MLLQSSIIFSMNKLSTAKRVQILSALVEGNSLRSTSRMVGCSINTVTKLLVDLGNACAKYQDKALRNLPYPVRRNLELLLLESEERSAGQARPVRRWRCLDLDGDLR